MDLVRRAEAGDDIVLTRHGHPAVRLVPVKTIPDGAKRVAPPDTLRDAGAKAKGTESAARSQDFLDGKDGQRLRVVATMSFANHGNLG